MKSILKIIGLVVLIVIGFTLYQKFFNDATEIIKTRTIVEKDTTTIDSLKSVISFYQSIPPAQRDTIIDTVYIEKPIYVNDSTSLYQNTYSDSTLDATITSKVSIETTQRGYRGVLAHQTFSYYIKQERVRRVENVITLNTVETITTTNTIVKKPNSYFAVGAEIGPNTVGPILGFTKPGQFNVFYRYDIQYNSHNIGFQIPIQF